MKAFVLRLLLALVLLGLFGCSHGAKQSEASQTATTPKSQSQVDTFTGEVVKVDEGYRFKPANDPESLKRLTRAKKRESFVAEEINLRKYFSKTIVVRGGLENEWIWRAEIVGQWLHPGEKRGSTLTGPEPPPKH